MKHAGGGGSGDVDVSIFYFGPVFLFTTTPPRSNMKHALHSVYKSAAERLTPVLSTSGYAERGVSGRG
jgi:hypothetical protein